MFFFIGGVQPKKVTLDDNPRMCPNCGLALARLKRIDHYVSLFFIPLIPVKRGQPFLECSRCQGVFNETGQTAYETRGVQENQCPSCGEQLEQGYSFCPYCGKKV